MTAGSSSCPRPTVRRWAVVAALASALVGLTTACSSEPSRAHVVDNLERTGLSKPVAECVADAFFEELPDKDIERISERGSTGVVDDLEDPDEPIDKARARMAKCQDLETATTTTEGVSTTTSEVATTTSDVATTTEPSTSSSEGSNYIAPPSSDDGIPASTEAGP